MPDDKHLSYQVERALGLLPSVNLRNVRVQVDNKHVVIQGIVFSEEEKRAIISAAGSVPGVASVEEAIAVEDPGTAHSMHTEVTGQAGIHDRAHSEL